MPENKEKLIVITGAGGFIGGHLDLRASAGAVTRPSVASTLSRSKIGTSGSTMWRIFPSI